MIQKEKAEGVSPLKKNHKNEAPPWSGGIKIQAETLISASPETCYAYWRDFKNLPLFMSHLDSVKIIDKHRSHWTVEAPADTTIEWDAEIIEDKPNERISWRSLPESQMDNAGSVSFQAAGSGKTQVKVAMTYNPPLGIIGDALASLFGESPEQQVADDLNRFKKAMERNPRKAS